MTCGETQEAYLPDLQVTQSSEEETSDSRTEDEKATVKHNTPWTGCLRTQPVYGLKKNSPSCDTKHLSVAKDVKNQTVTF